MHLYSFFKKFLETILVAFRHFSDQFGLCYYMAIRGTVAHSPLRAKEEKVSNKIINSHVIQYPV